MKGTVMKFSDKIRGFLYGRYGIDALYYALFVSFLLIWVVRLFVSNIALAIILYIAELLLLGWMLFRVFSRNIYKRRKENEIFLGFFRKIKSFFVLQKDRIRDIKKIRYRKCPHCKAMLRLPPKKGKHSVKCPRCGKSFDVRVII